MHLAQVDHHRLPLGCSHRSSARVFYLINSNLRCGHRSAPRAPITDLPPAERSVDSRPPGVAAGLSSLRGSLAIEGVTSILQAKIRHQRFQVDRGFAKTTVRLNGGSSQVDHHQVIKALLDQLAQVESLAASGDPSETL